jgi:hypothetical protein
LFGGKARLLLRIERGLNADVLWVHGHSVELALGVLDDEDLVAVGVDALGDAALEASGELEAVALGELVSALDVVVYGFRFAFFLLLLSVELLGVELSLEFEASLFVGVVVRHSACVFGGCI